MSLLDMVSILKDERVLIGLAAASAGLVVKVLCGRQLSRPPGPTVWPIVGSLPYLRNGFLIFKELADIYGDICYVELGLFGHQPTVVLSSIDLVREALLKKQNDFAGRYRTHTIDVISAGGKDIPFGDYNPIWQFQRKLSHMAIRKYSTGPHFQDMLSHNVDLVSDVFRKTSGELTDIHNPVSLVFYNIIASMCFGKKYDLNDPEFNNIRYLVDELNDSFTGLPLADLWPPFKYLPSAMLKVVCRNMAALENFIDSIIYDHKDSFDINDIRDLTYFFIKAGQETKSTPTLDGRVQLDHIHLQQVLIDMLTAGTDTSRTTLIWALLFLAAHPDIQSKARAEIHSQLGRDAEITLSNRSSVPYCEAIIYETMRLRLPAPIALPHKTTCDTTVGGYDIPKGTQVIINLVSVHMDPRQWDKPEEFRPERFIDIDGNLAPKPNSYLPFSTGRRQCVGETLAKSSLHVILANLLQRFTFSAPPGCQVDVTFKKSILAYFPNNTHLVVKEC